jgi:hypothetical protein
MSEKVGGIIWNLLLFGGFVYVFLIMHGITKTSLEIKTLQKPTLFVRLLVYAGLLLFGLLVVMDFLGK